MGSAIATIVSSLISSAGAIIVCMIANRKQSALMEYKLDELTKKVDKHNTVIERTYKLEDRADVFDEKIKVANHRIDDLETKA